MVEVWGLRCWDFVVISTQQSPNNLHDDDDDDEGFIFKFKAGVSRLKGFW